MLAYRARNPDVPIVPSLDCQIRDTITLRMDSWHGEEACGTTHCRAGGAIHLAGAPGYALEKRYGSEIAGRMIYRASTGRVPDFFATNEEASADIRRCAAQSEASP